MRTVAIDLFGALRETEADARLEIETAATTIGQLRADVERHAERWPPAARALLPRCAFASATTVLRDNDAMPADACLALLPPVSGG